MDYFEDLFRVFFFTVVAMIWAWRAKAALRATHHAPAIKDASLPPLPQLPLVSILIPVRNEEANIKQCINSLLAQDYPNIEIIVANDQSKDRTEDILRSFGNRIYYFNVRPTPKGWTGKNFALFEAVEHARGDWLLFTDADTRHEPNCLRSVMAHALKRQLNFLTLLPRCLTHGFLEDVLQPAMMSLTGLWFPMDKINDPKSSVFFGNGQFILTTAENYHYIEGHDKVRGEYLEDFALMKLTKKHHRKAECALGTDVFGTRMYDSFPRLWRGWRRIYSHAFEQDALILFQKIMETLVFCVLPFLVLGLAFRDAFLMGGVYSFTAGAGLTVCLFMITVTWMAYKVIRSKSMFAVFLPISAMVAMLILVDAWRVSILNKPTKWR